MHTPISHEERKKQQYTANISMLNDNASTIVNPMSVILELACIASISVRLIK